MSGFFTTIGAFTIIGAAVVAIAVIAAALIVVLALYYWLIDGRFAAIWFRKGQRRLSIASWWNSRILPGKPDDGLFEADDWVVNERPLYLSYRVGKRRVFLLAGLLSGPRNAAIVGQHPESADNTPARSAILKARQEG